MEKSAVNKKQKSELFIDAQLTQWSDCLHQNLQLDSVLNSALDLLMDMWDGFAAAELYLWDEKTQTLFVRAQRGLSPEYVETGTLQKGEGLAGTVAEKNRYFSVKNLKKENHDYLPPVEDSFASYIGIPLQFQGQQVGVLGLFTRETLVLSKSQQKTLTHMGTNLGMAIHNALTYERAAVRTRRFIAISRAITATRQLGTLHQVLQDITKVLVQSLGFDQSWIGLVNEDKTSLLGRAGFGAGISRASLSCKFAITRNSKNPAVTALHQRKPVVYQFIEDVQDTEYQKWLEKNRIESFAYVPILSGDRILGVIGVFYVTDQAFEDEDVKALVSVSEQAAIAIDNALLYEKIKDSEARYRTLFESGGTSLAIVDEKGVFRLVNHAFETISGWSRKDLIGKKTLFSFLPDESTRVTIPQNGLNSGLQSREARFLDKTGTEKQVHISAVQLSGTSDILFSLIDMTRQRELERRLFRSEELAAIGELSAGIAHEIRNPLVAITTSVSLLKDEPELSGEGRQLLDVVKEESDHLAAIVEDFLRFARPKRPSFQPEDINQLLQDVIRRHKDWKESGIVWEEKYDKNLSPIPLDRHQIQQVVTNLFLNAMDAMPGGGVLQIVTAGARGKYTGHVQVTISDSGMGIREGEIQKIFQPFYSTKEKGTGMGLAICRRIIEEHNGELNVESREGKGTIFSLILPVSQTMGKE
jgi:PAS domain S-box-containing protein